MGYRKFQIHEPTHEQFANPDFRWLTFVGDFIVPIVENENELLYWFANHNGEAVPNYQFCFLSADYLRIEEEMKKKMDDLHLTYFLGPKEGDGIEFAGDWRWMAEERRDKKDLSGRRADLVMRCLHSASKLLIDQIYKDGEHWKLEKNTCVDLNPLGNSFHSILHLIANLSGVNLLVGFARDGEWFEGKL